MKASWLSLLLALPAGLYPPQFGPGDGDRHLRCATEPVPVARPKLPTGDLAYRTDGSNQASPWYRLKPGEFPPIGSEHRVLGELLEADFIHRSGQFRPIDTGELVDFTLLPFATVLHLDAEGDLRDVPLGTRCQFSLYQDGRGAFTQVAAILDDFSRLARQGLVYRLDGADLAAGRLAVSARGPARGAGEAKDEPLRVDEKTRVWKGGGRAKLADLVVGDDLLANVDGGFPKGPRRCSDIWVGPEARTLATDRQHRRHDAFLRERGLAARVDRVEGNKLTVTPFGDPASLQSLFKQDGIEPARWAREGRFVDAVVANEELRTYNPPVDRKRARVLEFRPIPAGSHGCGGIRWVIEPDLLLEGFREGRIVRLFVHPSWPVNDMPFGEGLYTEAPGVRPALEEPDHYPFRTDFANEDLPWYRPRPGEFPPLRSEHRVVGELVTVDADRRSGRFRADRTGEVAGFTMPPYGAVFSVDAEADLADLTTGTRYRFSLHQDDQGGLTRATVIEDDVTDLAAGDLSYRVDSVDLPGGKLLLSKRHAPVKNEKEDLVQPPDLGRGIFEVNAASRAWKGNGRIGLDGLLEGDDLLVNLGGRSSTSRGICTDIWVGAEARQHAKGRQRAKHDASARDRGLPAWIDRAEGNSLTITFFAGRREGFASTLEKDARGDGVDLVLADDELRPIGGAVARSRLKDQRVEHDPGVVHGSGGVQWRLEAERVDERYRPGRVVRVFRDGWKPRGE